MTNLEQKFPYKKGALNSFFIADKKLSFDEASLREIDLLVSNYEKTEIDSNLEKSIRLRNDLLTSFAVSKAENSDISLYEAEDIYKDILAGGDDFPKFLKNKIKRKEVLTKKDHDRLEYYNIAKTLKEAADLINIKSLSPKVIKDLHSKLTVGLDVFAKYIANFETYNSGELRQDDKVRVADYKPSPCAEIPLSLKELIDTLKKDQTATGIFTFHAALYALHPFKNGNKRVCRVLEHFLLQNIGYNTKNLYSASYFYHKNIKRYYSRLLDSLYKRNLSYFVSFAQEALYFSALGVIAGVLQRKKADFLDNSDLDKNVKKIIKVIIKKDEVQFSRFFALSKRKVSKQTFVNYLDEALRLEVLNRRESGRNVLYSLAGNYPEREMLKEWIDKARQKGVFIPDDLR